MGRPLSFSLVLLFVGGFVWWSSLPLQVWADPASTASPNSTSAPNSRSLSGQSESPKSEVSKPDAAKAELLKPLTVEQEQAAIDFARSHHPELADLLTALKGAGHAKYSEAVSELHRHQERLARLETRSPERHAGELELWKIDSRIRLILARLTMGESDILRDELQVQLRQKQALRTELMQQERDRLATRLARLNESLATSTQNAEQSIQMETERLMKSARSRATKRTTSSKSSAEKSSTTKTTTNN
ncbi:MAG: hypothetical protein R3C01_00600 [Planctomycetaceae bacterium]